MNMLRSIREKKGLTVSQLAARAGVSSKAILDYEAGRQAIPLQHAKLLAKALWVSIEDLMPPPGVTVQQPHVAPTQVPASMQPTNNNNSTAAPPLHVEKSIPANESRIAQPRPRPPAGAEGRNEARSPRQPRQALPALPPKPLTEGQMQELVSLAARLQIDRQKLEERVGKDLGSLARPEAKEWIKRLRAMADELAPAHKVRYGKWPNSEEDPEAAYLRAQQNTDTLFAFKLFNGEQFTGAISDFTPYTISIKLPDGEEMVLRKLAIAYYRRLPTNGIIQSIERESQQQDPTVSNGTAHDHARDDHHQPVENNVESDRTGTPDMPEEDNMDEDRGA